MKNPILLILVFAFIFPMFLFSQTNIPEGDVSGTWAIGNSPYLIEGEITIPNDSVLIIGPGVIVEFQGHYKFKVNGKILALGEQSDTITFTINDTTGYSNTEIPDGGWNGLRFGESNDADTSFLQYCKFEYGKGVGSGYDAEGGAIRLPYGNHLEIFNCLFHSNFSTYGSAAINSIGSDITIGFCHFFNNNGPATISLIVDGDMTLFNSVIRNNNGIGILQDSNDADIINNVISDNTGGGINYTDPFGGRVINNTICNNTTSSYGGGAGIHIYYCCVGVLFYNNIIYGNTSDEGNQIFIQGSGADTTFLFHFYNNNIEGGSEGFGGEVIGGDYENNIDADPQFSNTGEHPYMLMPNSPCIDIGNPDTNGLNLPFLDLAGNPRIYNNLVDIGAYEYFATNINHQNPNKINIKLFPNPSSGQLWIEKPNSKQDFISVEIFNSFGKKLMEFETSEDIMPVDLSEKPKGVYLIRIKSGSKVFSEKIIVQ